MRRSQPELVVTDLRITGLKKTPLGKPYTLTIHLDGQEVPGCDLVEGNPTIGTDIVWLNAFQM
jgi:hypothetical protein